MERQIFSFIMLFVLQIILSQGNGQIIPGKSPVSEPYPYLNNFGFKGKAVPGSHIPLLARTS